MHSVRKSDHLRICLEKDVRPASPGTGLERYRFAHQALPEVDLDQISTDTEFLGQRLRAPILISAMTGGTPAARTINRRLAQAAQELGIAMVVGSQRAALESPELANTFRVRDVAPDILLFANLGAVQLGLTYGVEHCLRAVEMIEADGLVLHLNPLQEALQPGGDSAFAGLQAKIQRVCEALPVPVVVKEVGCGLAGNVAQALAGAGASAVDVAGAGGTSWSAVERYRIEDPCMERVAAQFAEWGIPTADSLRAVRRAVPDLPVIASGGLQTGIDVAKCLALGASVAGLAWPLLRPSLDSAQAVVNELRVLERGLRIAMFCIGAQDLPALRQTPHLQEIHP